MSTRNSKGILMNNVFRVKRNRAEQERPVTTSVSARTRVIASKVQRADVSRQVEKENPFGTTSALTAPLSPPYDPDFLYKCKTISNMLQQCITAYVTNIAQYGYEVVPITPHAEIDENERQELLSFIDAPNIDESLASLNSKCVEDYETFGYEYIEVIRDRRERVSLLRHMLASTVRLMPKDGEEDAVEVSYQLFRGGRTVTVREMKTFRRYVQVVHGKFRYFKEMGDPRNLDYVTGKYETKDYPVPPERRATEVLHRRQYSDEPYGIPRWINQLPNILGSREAEECNLRYFEDNTIPPIVLSVSGGRLTGESYRELKRAVGTSGKDKQHRVMLIEAIAEREGLDDKGTVDVKVDKLTDARQSDGLFKAYDEGNQSKVRSAFRLAGVHVGMSEEHTYATANTSTFLVETQVFAPERAMRDEYLNKRLINAPEGLGLRTCKLQSRVPPITNSETIIKTMTALNVMGGLTPRMANAAADGLLQMDIPDYPMRGEEGYEDWMDRPIQFVTRGIKSQTGQEAKDDDVKDTEETGDTSMSVPEHGEE